MPEFKTVDSAKIPGWFKSEVVRIFALYPAAKMSTATIAAWWEELKSLDEPTLKAAIRSAVSRSREFIPSAPAILDCTRQSEHEGASIAWGKIYHELCTRGPNSFRFNEFDACTQRALDLAGGIRALSDMTTETLPFVRKRFESDWVTVKSVEAKALCASAGTRHLIGKSNA